MKFKHKKTAKSLPVSNLNVTRYTLDAWLKTYPESNEDEWDTITCHDDPYAFVKNTLSIMNVKKQTSIRIVTLDEEFFDYLDKNKLENNEQNRVQYINTISDEDALRLYNKQPYNTPIETYGLCFIFCYMNEQTDIPKTFCLNKENRNELREYFEKIFGKNNIAVSKYLFRPDTFVNEFDRISSMGKTLLTKNNDISYAAYENMDMIEGATLIRRYLPITIKTERTTPHFKLINYEDPQMLIRQYPEIINMQEKDLTETGFKDIPEISTLKCFDNIKQMMKAYQITPEPFITHYQDVFEEEEEFIKILKKEARKTKTKIIKANYP